MFNVNIIHHATKRPSGIFQLAAQFSEASFALSPSWQHKRRCQLGTSALVMSFLWNFNHLGIFNRKISSRKSRIYGVAEFTSYFFFPRSFLPQEGSRLQGCFTGQPPGTDCQLTIPMKLKSGSCLKMS